MRSVYFEKYCTMINAFISRSIVLWLTQSCPTENSIMIYEAESGVISDPDKIPHWVVLVLIILEAFAQEYVILASWIARFQALLKNKAWVFSSVRYLIETPLDLNPSERRHVACCGRWLKDAPSANFDHARRKIQRLKTDSLKRLRLQRTCKEMEIAAFGSFARIWEEAIRLVETCCASGTDDDSDPMDFDNEVLDALAHLDSAPAAPINIKTF